MTRTPFLDTILAEIQKKRLFQRRKRAVVTEMSRRSAGNAGAARGLSDTRVAFVGQQSCHAGNNFATARTPGSLACENADWPKAASSPSAAPWAKKQWPRRSTGGHETDAAKTPQAVASNGLRQC
jgi:hypothetical protein